MRYRMYEVALLPTEQFDGKLPCKESGVLLAELTASAQCAVSVALRGSFRARGKIPRWLEQAADIRIIGLQVEHQPLIHIEAPAVGEALPEEFEQPTLWPALCEYPLADQTSLDLLCQAVAAVENRDMNSWWLDPSLLKGLLRFRHVFFRYFREVSICGIDLGKKLLQRLTPNLLRNAEQLYQRAPKPKTVRIAGLLDMIRLTTRRFGLKLNTGETVYGSLVKGSIEDMATLLGTTVVVSGVAIFSPSGRMLRVETTNFRPATERDTFFSRVPEPILFPLTKDYLFLRQPSKKGAAAVVGKWPGNETDDEINTLLREIS